MTPSSLRSGLRSGFAGILLAIVSLPAAHAAEHITLTNGFDLICDHREVDGGRVRLYTDASSYVEVNASEIASTEHVDLPPAATPANAASVSAT
ncbi:MAG: hypothetical protein QM649_16220, partial [Silvibacterium sp.]